MAQLTFNRIDSLDWLRGLMALSIMFYHYFSWVIAEPSINSVLGKLGIYAVSIFFVLSGLSLAIVYNNHIKGLKTSLIFFVRRIFRIWPVLWISVFFATAVALYSRQPLDLKTIALNLTTLFGFFDHAHYLSAGLWSIGNEMVYYALTPLIIMLFNRKRLYGNIFFALTVSIGLIFSFHWINNRSTFIQEWNTYINPFNNLFFFVSGIALYYNFKNIKIKNIAIIVSLITVGFLFSFIDVGEETIAIVTGKYRMIFSAFSILAAFLFWKITFVLPHLIGGIWNKICLATYSIYLLHPYVRQAVRFFAKDETQAAPFILISLYSVLTVIVSLAVYRFIEKPFIALGKRLTAEKIVVPAAISGAN